MSYSRLALTISLLCTSYCIIYQSVLVKYEAINSFVYSLGVISNCVSLSIIASCLFYLFTDYLPKKHQYDHIHDYIMLNLELLEKLGAHAFVDISNMEEPTEQEFINACDVDLMKRTSISKQVDSSFSSTTNWFEYFNLMHEREKCIIQQILIFESMIPIEVRLIFIELQKSNTIFTDYKSYKDFYQSDKNKRSVRVYASDIYNHLISLAKIKQTFNETYRI